MCTLQGKKRVAKLGIEWLRGKEARQRWLLRWLKNPSQWHSSFSVPVSKHHKAEKDPSLVLATHPQQLGWGNIVGAQKYLETRTAAVTTETKHCIVVESQPHGS